MAHPLPRPFRLFLAVTAGLTALCLACEAYWALLLHRPTPYDWPLFPRGYLFADLDVYRQRFLAFHSPAFFHQPGLDYMYPAPLALVYRFFYSFRHPGQVFVLFAALAVAIALTLFFRALLARGLAPLEALLAAATLLLCSYPFFFELQQANLEFFVWLVLSLGFLALLRRRPWLAAACFGLAGASKLFPFVFFGLLLARRQYRQAAFGLVVSAVATLVSLWAICPALTTSARQISSGLAAFRTVYVLQYRSLAYDHSLFGLYKTFLAGRGTPSADANLPQALTLYLAFFATLGVVLYLARIRKLPLVNQLTALTVASILLPPVSYDYTLIHLYAPTLLLLLLAAEQTAGFARGLTPGLTPALLLLAVLLSPQSELILAHHILGGQLKALALAALFAVALRFPFPSRYDLPPHALSPQAPLPRDPIPHTARPT